MPRAFAHLRASATGQTTDDHLGEIAAAGSTADAATAACARGDPAQVQPDTRARLG